MNNAYDVIVIGAGPAGLVAAGTAASYKKSVLLIEKNNMIGKKLRITGKGRCNITNTASDEDFFDNLPVNSSFMYSSYYNFNNYSVIDFFEKLGLELKIERGGRVFPQSDKAIDVVKALDKYIVDNNVIIKNEKVEDLIVSQGTVKGVRTNLNTYTASKIILATGGMSYPLTGSTGDGYKMVRKFGHRIVPIKPSLVPIETDEEWVKNIQGLSLKNVEVKLIEGNKFVFSDFGEMIFTHFGVSGPIILSASSHIDLKKNYKLLIDLKPALTIEQLDKRVLRDFEKYINKQFSNSLGELLPKNLIPVIIELSKIDPQKHVNSITKEERLRFVNLLKGIELNIKGLRPVSEAIITSGGVNVKEINPSTMESKLVQGLYFAGELIDVDAYTGGFNLQIAFSTGYLAGQSAGEVQ